MVGNNGTLAEMFSKNTLTRKEEKACVKEQWLVFTGVVNYKAEWITENSFPVHLPPESFLREQSRETK